MKKLQIVVFTILLLGVVNCQSWKILTINDSSIKLDNFSSVQNDTLVGIKSGDVIEVPIQNILSIRYKNINVGRGILGGCLGWITGAITGMFIGASTVDNYETGANVGVIVGVIAGYLIFSKSLGTEYKLNNMTLEQKVNKIKTLIEVYEK